MTKIISNSKEPTVTNRHDYATEAHNESEEYPFMASCNNDELGIMSLPVKKNMQEQATPLTFLK